MICFTFPFKFPNSLVMKLLWPQLEATWNNPRILSDGEHAIMIEQMRALYVVNDGSSW